MEKKLEKLPENLPTKWDLSPLFASDTDAKIEEEKKRVEAETKKFVEKWESRQDYLTDPKILKEALDDFNAWIETSGTNGKVGYYFQLRNEVVESAEVKTGLNQIENLSRQLGNQIQFFTLRLGKVTEAKQKEFLAFADLKIYWHFLERLFIEAKYTLTEPEEKIMTLFGGPAMANWVRLVSSLLAKEEVNGKNFSEIVGLVDDTDKVIRDVAAKNLNQIFVKHLDVAEAEINSVLAVKKTSDELRGLARPDLYRHLGDEVESAMVDTLVNVVADDFETPQKFYALKAKLLGLPKLAYHERNVPIGSLDKKYSYQSSAELVYNSLSKLDAEFAEIFYDFVIKGQIDVYPKKNKGSGAFCSHDLLSAPTFIMLNHNDKARDVLTLAHETGHGINNELIKKRQPAIYFDTPVSTAEVASTFMEDFALQEIASGLEGKNRLALIMTKLGDDISTIYRQIAFYRFETELHQTFRAKSFLSHQEIGAIFKKHMASYMGPAVEQSPGSENWWVYVSHFRAFFYVYSYASGLLISKSLQNLVRKNPAEIVKVKEFLSTGTSDSPKNIFAKLGIDISSKEFWQAGLGEIKKTFAEAEKLAQELKLI
ncbi:MAG: M3 family oligoendopeptidase [Patescibacteria group bacterium]